MFKIDGKEVDLTKPETWGNSIKLKPGGFIEQRKDGVTTRIERVEPNQQSKDQPLKGV